MDESSTNNLEKYLQDQVDRQNVYGKTNKKKRTCKAGDSNYGIAKKRSKKLKEFIGNTDDLSNALPYSSNEDNNILDKRKFERLKQIRINENDKFKNIDENEFSSPIVKNDKPISKAVIYSDDENILDNENIYDSDYKPTEDEYISSNEECEENSKKIKLVVNTKVNVIKKNRKSISKGIKLKDKKRKIKDDGNLEDYKKRILKWKKGEALKTLIEYSDLLEEDNFKEFDGGFKLPLVIWDKLYLYQKTGVHWLWELHCQRCGGILGDEMGLGKTIQVIAFLVGISYSKMIQTGYKWKGLGPILIVSPTTILHQWVKEFHRWWPLFRVAILHESGSFKGKRAALIHNINRYGGILITSYTGLRDQIKILLQYDWHYFILDEGHKIRNPESQITIAVKRFTTPHKIILSGSPIQNSLKELWSLFDFVFPGKLGTLEVFLQQFSVPITRGGYVNASKLEVQTAYRCAIILRDTISPYLLRRLKSDVMHHLNLPDKTEQVLFCALTDEQRSLYRDYISGKEVDCILKGRLRVFVGLIILRKICNHPDLYSFFPSDDINESAASYGWWKRSGKMLVLHAILKLWNSQGHRVLLFSQSKKMMDILEKFIKDQGYTYMKMDGSTNIGSRQRLIDVFNDDSSVFVFLLTTRVGGLGVNLIGANRVVIFDPDWNPSTDIQARERAWRIGQTKEVTVYRLLTAGTIEEKIYHRQIFKQFLTNRILKNPKQQRFFKSNDLYELFTLNEGDKEKTESSAIFAGTGSEIKFKKHKRSQYKHRRESSKTQEIFKLGEKDTKVLMSHTCSDMLNDEELEKPVCEFDFITKETNIQDQKPEDPNYLVQISNDLNNLDQKPEDPNDPVYISNDLNNLDQKPEDPNDPVQISNDLNNLDQKPEDPNDPVYISNDLNNLDQKPEDPNDPVYISNDLNNLDQKSEDPNDPVHKSHSQNILDQNDLVHISDESKTLEENQEFSNCLAQESADITSPDKKSNDFIMELDFNGDFEDGEILEDESINLENVGSIDVDAKENSEIKTLYQNTQSSSGFQALLDVRIHDEKKEKMMQLAKLLSKKIAENKLLSKPTDDKNSKEKRKKKKGKVFEGERIEHLVKKRAYNPDKNLDKEEEERKAVNKAQDEFLLAKLFKKSRVHTALSHDAIVNSSDPDYLILENEAERVAKEAMKQVRMSRNNYVRPSANLGHKKKPRFGRESSSFHKTILLKTKKDIELQIEDSKATASSVSNILKNNTKSDNIGVSNMTTSSKDMPNPNSLLSENFFGNSKISFGDNNLSSSNLLSQIKARNRPIDHIQQNNNARRTVNDEENYDSAYPSTAETYVNEEINESNEHIELLNDIRCFVAFQACIDGSASTEEIVEKFKDRLPNNHSHIFRALLKEICEFRRNSSGIGMWHIKNELR